MSTEKPLVDQEARDAIRRNLDVTMMVEAAAGTGKTTSLVQRIVELVRSGTPVREIAAITFTIKAAAHLREAFQEKLEQVLRESVGEDRTRLSAALEELEGAFIGTIHSFCARLLRERPVEAGLDPSFEELDETDGALIGGEFWDGWVQRLFASNAPILRELLDAGVEPKDLRQSFGRLCQYPDVRIVSVPTQRPSVELASAVVQLRQFVESSRPQWPPFNGSDEDDDLTKVLRSVANQLRFLLPDDDVAAVHLLENATRSVEVTLKKWNDGKAAKRLCADYERLQQSVLDPAVTRWREYVHPIAIRAMAPAFGAFRQERRREGRLTFQDLLMEARDLLRDHPQVRRYFQRRFRRLLVDEFQDTDPIQAEIILYLTSDDVDEKSWRRLRPRPGALFIVGDPKQSIYRFRRADITTYEQVAEIIRSAGGEVRTLTTNFRSVPEICNWVNGFFRNVFTEDAAAAGSQARHVDISPHRPSVSRGGVYAQITGSTGKDQKGDDIAAREAEAVSNWIGAAVESRLEVVTEKGPRPARWGDFLLISRITPRLQIYTEALEAKGIPYEVTGGRALRESQEVADLLSFLRAVVDPDNTIAVVAWLRGAYCGVDDQALYDFVQARGRFSFFATRPDGCDGRIASGLELLREAHGWGRTLPPAAALSRILDRLGIVAQAVTGPNGGTRAGNLLKVATMARKMSAEGDSLNDVVERLVRIVEERLPVEEMDIDPAREDVVRVMNLHQAKGLEAPFVFLIDPVELKEHEPDKHIDRAGEEPLGYFPLFTDVEKGDRTERQIFALPPDWDRVAQTEQSFAQREEERLLYVAATRAKDVLSVGIQHRQLQKEIKVLGPWSRFASSLGAGLFSVVAPGSITAELPPVDFAAEFAREESQRTNARREAEQPTYAVSLVTKIAHDSGVQMARVEEGFGRGTSWGRVMHRLLEAILRDEHLDVKFYAESLLKDEEREPAELPDVMRVIESVRSSPVWQRVKRADDRLLEVPFALMVSNRELGREEDGETLLHGVVDLVFREADEWFVVDYKSDVIDGRLDSLVKYYRPQVEHYARFWSSLTGKPTRAGLFFVDAAEMVWVA